MKRYVFVIVRVVLLAVALIIAAVLGYNQREAFEFVDKLQQFVPLP